MSYCMQLVDVKRSGDGQELTNCCPASATKCLVITPCGSSKKTDVSGKSGCCGKSGNCDSDDCVCIKLSAMTESTCVLVKPDELGQKPVNVCVC